MRDADVSWFRCQRVRRQNTAGSGVSRQRSRSCQRRELPPDGRSSVRVPRWPRCGIRVRGRLCGWAGGALHHACLYRRCVRAQQHIGLAADEECVLHVAGGMVGGKVERREQVPVVFDFRPSAMLNPRRRKIAMISSRTSDSGWRVP